MDSLIRGLLHNIVLDPFEKVVTATAADTDTTTDTTTGRTTTRRRRRKRSSPDKPILVISLSSSSHKVPQLQPVRIQTRLLRWPCYRHYRITSCCHFLLFAILLVMLPFSSNAIHHPPHHQQQQQQQLLTRILLPSLVPPKTILTWVNGIGHNLSHMTTGQAQLSNLFHRPIEFCHNPTFMSSEDDTFGYLGDLTQCTSQKLLGKITLEVEELVLHLKEAIRKVGRDGKVIHIAHSQGALITYLACKKLEKDEMRQMEVICFGGAEVIRSSEEYPFHRCINYYSVNDPLLFVVPQAAKALRSGFMGMGMGMSYGNIQGINASSSSSTATRRTGAARGTTMTWMTDPMAEPEFVFLTPREGDPVKDHGLFGKTYLDALRWEGRRYQALYLPAWHPLTYMACTQGRDISVLCYDKLILYCKAILRHTIWKFVVFVMSVNDWIKENIIVPLAVFLVMLWERIKQMTLAILRGGEEEDVYEPVEVVVR